MPGDSEAKPLAKPAEMRSQAQVGMDRKMIARFLRQKIDPAEIAGTLGLSVKAVNSDIRAIRRQDERDCAEDYRRLRADLSSQADEVLREVWAAFQTVKVAEFALTSSAQALFSPPAVARRAMAVWRFVPSVE